MAARSGRRFEFGWLEVFGLILIFTGGSAIVFFLGVFVGKGLQESRLQREERVVRLPVNPRSEEKPDAGRDSELRLSDELARGGPTATPGVALAVRRSPDALPTAPSDAPRASAAAHPLETPRAAEVARNEDITRAGSVVPSPAARLGDHTEDAGGAGQKWSVQVNATKDEPTANQLVRRLQERGYNAYIVRVSLQGETWYRVRVGRFPTMEAATAVVVRLKNEERYARAFLVND